MKLIYMEKVKPATFQNVYGRRIMSLLKYGLTKQNRAIWKKLFIIATLILNRFELSCFGDVILFTFFERTHFKIHTMV